MSKFHANIFLMQTTSNYLWASEVSKNHFFKVDYFIFTLFLVPKLRSVAQNEWKKHPYIFFFTFGSKINEFERKKSEKNEKIPKT